MGLSKRSFSWAATTLLGLALVIAACTESGDPLLPEPGPQPGPSPLGTILCRGNTATLAIACEPAGAGAGGANADAIFLADQNVNVRVYSENVALDTIVNTPSDTTFTIDFDVRVVNMIGQAIGTNTGADLDSVKVFFNQGPTATSPGTIDVFNEDGTSTFTGTNQPYFAYGEILAPGDTSLAKRWRLSFNPVGMTFSFLLYVNAPVRHPRGWVTIDPPADTIPVGGTTTLSATVRNRMGTVLGTPVTWSSLDPAVATVDGSGVVSGVARGSAQIVATAPNDNASGFIADTAEIVVNSDVQPVNDLFFTIAGHTLARTASGGLIKNDSTGVDAGDVLRVVPDTIEDSERRFTVDSLGAFSYVAKPGRTLALADSITYRLTDGIDTATAYAIFTPRYRVWYVDVSRAAGDPSEGTDHKPFRTLGEAASAAEAADSIFVLTSGGSNGIDQAATLKAGQVVLGQGVPTAIVDSLNGVSVTLLAAGSTPTVTSAGTTVTLGGTNTLRGLSLASTAGGGIAGLNFGVLTVSELSVAATGGPALDLETGAVRGVIASLSSTNSATQGVDLVGVDSAFTVNGGTITGATDAAFSVSGGGVSVAYAGGILKANNGALLSVAGGHTGTLAFTGTLTATNGFGLSFVNADGVYNITETAGTTSLNGGDAAIDIVGGSAGLFRFGTGVGVGASTSPSGTAFTVANSTPDVFFKGSLRQTNNAALVDISDQQAGPGKIRFVSGSTLTASNGTGIQLTNVADSVEFNGAATLSGGDAGIDVLGSSIGTLVFGAQVSVVNPTGSAFVADGGSPEVAFSGTLKKTGTSVAPLVRIANQALSPRAITFAAGSTLADSTSDGTGIVLQDVLGSAEFEGTVDLIGGANGVDVISSDGTITFEAGTKVVGVSGVALNVTGGSPALVFKGNITTSNATSRPVLVNGITADSVSVQGTIMSTGQGILVQNNTGGRVAFAGASKSLITAATPGVSLLGNTAAASIAFTGGGLLIQTTTGTGFNAASGTVTVTGPNNVIDTEGGTALSVVGATIGADSLVFKTIQGDPSGANLGILLDNTGSLGMLSVTGDGSAGSGGTITGTGTSGHVVRLNNTLGAKLRFMTLSTSASGMAGVSGNNFGTLTVESVTSSVTNGPALSLTDGSVNGSFTALSSTNSTSSGVLLTRIGGSFTVAGGSISGATAPNSAFFVSEGAVSITGYAGSITQANNAALLTVNGGHTGSLTFSGSLNASNGTGLQFSNASGSYTFNGTNTLDANAANGDAGVDILSSNGTFVFASGTSIASPTGVGLNVDGSTPAVVFAGPINATKGRAVRVANTTADSVRINGAVSSTSGAGSPTTGILVDNVANAIVRFAGNVSGTGPNAGITVQNSDAGATIAFTGNKTLNMGTGTGVAVNLASNTGADIRFENGGLDIDTDDGNGFQASGGGTLSVTGATNDVTSTGGVAVSVQGMTIGGSNVAFRSVSANGGASGIVLANNNGGGSFSVTGNGGTCSTPAGACTGGKILNTSGPAISLSSVSNLSFDRMGVQNTGSSGVRGTGVTNFSFTNGAIDNSGTSAAVGAEESNIDFYANTAPGTENNLSGTVTITGNALTNALFHGVDIGNYAGTIGNLTIMGNAVTSSTSTATSKGTGIRVIAFGGAGNVASVTRATISNNVVSNFPSDAGIMFQGGNSNAGGPAGTYGTPGSATDVIAITGNRIRGQSAANRIGTQAILALVNGRGQGNFDISNNGTVAEPLTNVTGHVISHSVFGQARVTSNISNNVIVANNSLASQGIGAGADSTAGMASFASLRLTISGNNISAVDGNGILAVARASSDSMFVKVLNNTVAAPLSGVRPGISVQSGSAAGNTYVCARIEGNTSAGSGGTNGIGVRKQGTVATTNFYGLHNIAQAAPTNAEVQAHVNGQNPAGNGTLIQSGSNYRQCSLP